MDILDYCVIGLYLLVLLVVGYRLRQQQTKGDYFLAGRTIGWKPLVLSIMATQLSAVSFISAPAFVGFREGGGLIWLSYELAVPLAMLLLLATVLPSLYRSGVVSIYDYLEKRFSISTRVCISIVFQFSRAFATGVMVYALSITLQGTMDISNWQAILMIGVVTILYSLQGGMKAVVYGDAIQMVIIVLGTVVCAVVGLHALGGWASFLQLVPDERLTAVNFSSLGFSGDGFGFFPMLLGGVVLYASYYGCDQSEAQRALSAKSEPELRKMIIANGLLRFPVTLLYCVSGLIVGTLAFSNAEFLAQIPKENPDWLMPLFILNYLPNGLIGLLVVAILAAAMSSLSSAINSLSAVSLEDICKVMKRDLSSLEHLKTAKGCSVIWGGVILLLSLYAGNIAPTVIEAVNKVGSVFFGPVLAVFLLGIATQKVRAFHVNVGLFCGVAFNLYLAFFVTDLFWFWWNVSGFLGALVVSLVASLLAERRAKQDKESNESKSITDSTEHSGMSSSTISNPLRNSLADKSSVAILVAYFLLLVLCCYFLPMVFY